MLQILDENITHVIMILSKCS